MKKGDILICINDIDNQFLIYGESYEIIYIFTGGGYILSSSKRSSFATSAVHKFISMEEWRVKQLKKLDV